MSMFIGSIVGVGLSGIVGAIVGALVVTLFYRRNPNKQALVNKEVDSISKKL